MIEEKRKREKENLGQKKFAKLKIERDREREKREEWVRGKLREKQENGADRKYIEWLAKFFGKWDSIDCII